MSDRLPSLSSEPAGRHHAQRRLPDLAPAPPRAPPASPTAIQGGRVDLSVIPEYEHQFAFANQQPDASAGCNIDFDADIDPNLDFNFELDIDVSSLAISDTDAIGVDDVSPFLGQYGYQTDPAAGAWNHLGSTSQRIQQDCRQEFLSPSTATPSQTAPSVFDTASIRSGVTAASQSSTVCDRCLKPWSSVRQKNRHQRTAHGNRFRCRCQYASGRRDNYIRHIDKCRKKRVADQRFTCQCGEETDDSNDHRAHVEDCKLPPGRPPNSSRKISWLPFPFTG